MVRGYHHTERLFAFSASYRYYVDFEEEGSQARDLADMTRPARAEEGVQCLPKQSCKLQRR